MTDQEITKEIRAAIRQGDLQSVIALVGRDKARLNMMTTFGSWLHVAASFGKLEIVKFLVETGADVNVYGGISGAAPLHRAASDGHLDVVRFLLDHGAKLDVSEPERNPLFGAIYGGHADVAQTLIDAGIDTSVKYTGESMKNMDALAFAKERRQPRIERMLVAREGN